MQKYPMTINGAKLLQQELDYLKNVERPSVIQAIAEARSHGDLSENAEYDAAKNRQGFIEGRIALLSEKKNHANIIDTSRINNIPNIVFGAYVKLIDLENNNSVTYQIVGDDEADIKLSKISVNSPVAKSLIGKESGDVVEIHVPSGTKTYEISSVSYK